MYLSYLFFFSITIYTLLSLFFFFFFNDTATTEIYTLSLHDALPLLRHVAAGHQHRHDHRHVPHGVPDPARAEQGRARDSPQAQRDRGRGGRRLEPPRQRRGPQRGRGAPAASALRASRRAGARDGGADGVALGRGGGGAPRAEAEAARPAGRARQARVLARLSGA